MSNGIVCDPAVLLETRPLPETDDLPSFRRPPLVETVLGVQFERLPGFSNAHLGVFWQYLNDQMSGWQRLADNWTSVADASPIEPVLERFEQEGSWAPFGVRLSVSNEVAVRIQIRNQANTRMVQLQNGRLHLNWIGHTGSQYPRYEIHASGVS